MPPLPARRDGSYARPEAFPSQVVDQSLEAARLVAIADRSAPNGGTRVRRRHCHHHPEIAQTSLDDELALKRVDASPRKSGSYRVLQIVYCRGDMCGLPPSHALSPPLCRPTDEGRIRATDGDEPGRTGGCRPAKHRRSELISDQAYRACWARKTNDQAFPQLSTPRYQAGLEPVGAEVAQASTGTSKSALSRRFVATTEHALAELLAQEVSGLELVALMVDGVHVAEHCVVVALGLAEGATEDTTVVTNLLVGLRDRGLDVTRPLLVVIDGAKALRRAIIDVFDHRVIQRCQLHMDSTELGEDQSLHKNQGDSACIHRCGDRAVTEWIMKRASHLGG